ncbi:type IV pilin protein [Lysobacter sp. A378]
MNITERHMYSNTGKGKVAGFTLIELMIVVAVIAILAAVAYPSYADSVRKGHRGQAKADLMETAQLLERHRTVNNTYAGFNMGAFGQSPHTGTARYTIALANDDADGYDLTASPEGSQEKDTQCGALSINQAGVKSISSTSGSVERCW